MGGSRKSGAEAGPKKPRPRKTGAGEQAPPVDDPSQAGKAGAAAGGDPAAGTTPPPAKDLDDVLNGAPGGGDPSKTAGPTASPDEDLPPEPGDTSRGPKQGQRPRNDRGPRGGGPSAAERRAADQAERERQEAIAAIIGSRYTAEIDRKSRNFVRTVGDAAIEKIDLAYPTDIAARRKLPVNPMEVVVVSYDESSDRFFCVPAELQNEYVTTRATEALSQKENIVIGQTLDGKLEKSKKGEDSFVLRLPNGLVAVISGREGYPQPGEKITHREYSAVVTGFTDSGSPKVVLREYRDYAEGGAITQIQGSERVDYLRRKKDQWDAELRNPAEMKEEIPGERQRAASIARPRQRGRRFLTFDGDLKGGRQPFSVTALKPFEMSHRVGQQVDFDIRPMGRSTEGVEAMFEHDFQLYLALDAYNTAIQRHFQLLNALEEKKGNKHKYPVGKVRNEIRGVRREIMDSIVRASTFKFDIPVIKRPGSDSRDGGKGKDEKPDVEFTRYINPLNSAEFMGIVQAIRDKAAELEAMCVRCSEEHPEIPANNSVGTMHGGDTLLIEFDKYQQQEADQRAELLEKRRFAMEDYYAVNFNADLSPSEREKLRRKKQQEIVKYNAALNKNVYDAYPVLAGMITGMNAFETRFRQLRGLAAAGGEAFLRYRTELLKATDASKKEEGAAMDLKPTSFVTYAAEEPYMWTTQARSGEGRLRAVQHKIAPGDTIVDVTVRGDKIQFGVVRPSVDGVGSEYIAEELDRATFTQWVREGWLVIDEREDNMNAERTLEYLEGLTSFAEIIAYLRGQEPKGSVPYTYDQMANDEDKSGLFEILQRRVNTLLARYCELPDDSLQVTVHELQFRASDPRIRLDVQVVGSPDILELSLQGNSEDADVISTLQDEYRVVEAARAQAESDAQRETAGPETDAEDDAEDDVEDDADTNTDTENEGEGASDSGDPEYEDTAPPPEPEVEDEPLSAESVLAKLGIGLDREKMTDVRLAFGNTLKNPTPGGEPLAISYLQLERVDDDQQKCAFSAPELGSGRIVKFTFAKMADWVADGTLKPYVAPESGPEPEARTESGPERSEEAEQLFARIGATLDWANLGATRLSIDGTFPSPDGSGSRIRVSYLQLAAIDGAARTCSFTAPELAEGKKRIKLSFDKVGAFITDGKLAPFVEKTASGPSPETEAPTLETFAVEVRTALGLEAGVDIADVHISLPAARKLKVMGGRVIEVTEIRCVDLLPEARRVRCMVGVKLAAGERMEDHADKFGGAAIPLENLRKVIEGGATVTVYSSDNGGREGGSGSESTESDGSDDAAGETAGTGEAGPTDDEGPSTA